MKQYQYEMKVNGKWVFIGHKEIELKGIVKQSLKKLKDGLYLYVEYEYKTMPNEETRYLLEMIW